MLLTVLRVRTTVVSNVVRVPVFVPQGVLRNVTLHVQISVKIHVLQTALHRVRKLVADVVLYAIHVLECVLVFVPLNVRMDVRIARICVVGGATHPVIGTV